MSFSWWDLQHGAIEERSENGRGYEKQADQWASQQLIAVQPNNTRDCRLHIVLANAGSRKTYGRLDAVKCFVEGLLLMMKFSRSPVGDYG